MKAKSNKNIKKGGLVEKKITSKLGTASVKRRNENGLPGMSNDH